MKVVDTQVTVTRADSWITPEALRSYPNCVLVSSEGLAFPVSKWTLMVISPLFIKIFTQVSEESEDLRIYIDMESSVLDLLCQFICTGMVEGLQSEVNELLDALKFLGIDWQGLHDNNNGSNHVVRYQKCCSVFMFLSRST